MAQPTERARCDEMVGAFAGLDDRLDGVARRRDSKAKERERDARAAEFQRQRDAVQRERARLQEQLAAATADARGAAERERALYVRTSMLEQQVHATAHRAIEVASELEPVAASGGGARQSAGTACSPALSQPLSLEQAIDGLGLTHERWATKPAS